MGTGGNRLDMCVKHMTSVGLYIRVGEGDLTERNTVFVIREDNLESQEALC